MNDCRKKAEASKPEADSGDIPFGQGESLRAEAKGGDSSLPGVPAEEARKQYQKTAKKLARIGLITELDDMALAILCAEWQQYLDATEQVKKSGILVKSPNGFPVLNPYMTVANQAIKKIRSLLAEFGMTPGSRSRIHAAATAEDSDDEWSKLLK